MCFPAQPWAQTSAGHGGRAARVAYRVSVRLMFWLYAVVITLGLGVYIGLAVAA
jgi:hypothetical protein